MNKTLAPIPVMAAAVLMASLLAGQAAPASVKKCDPQPEQTVRYTLQVQTESIECMTEFLTFAPSTSN
jgi:hypothetical protein